eukprot:IDg21196t1
MIRSARVLDQPASDLRRPSGPRWTVRVLRQRGNPSTTRECISCSCNYIGLQTCSPATGGNFFRLPIRPPPERPPFAAHLSSSLLRRSFVPLSCYPVSTYCHHRIPRSRFECTAPFDHNAATAPRENVHREKISK